MGEFIQDIFVFGSNRAGISGNGAALYARQQWRAKNGVGEGPTGCAYALPTKATPYLTLSLQDVKGHVNKFLRYAEAHPELRFLLTRIGCGQAQLGGNGLAEAAIAALFVDASANVVSIDDRCAIVGPASAWAERVNAQARGK